jgi:hypothetical protein
MKVYGGMDEEAHVFLTSAVASRSGRSTPGKGAPGTH